MVDFNRLFQEINEYEASLGLAFYNQPDRRLDRYVNVKPYTHNRCILPSGAYLNASIVEYPGHPVRFIVTQAPKVDTLHAFLEMLEHEQVSLIIRLGGECMYEDYTGCGTLYFPDWPDHGVPSRTEFIQFHAEYRKRICALSKPTVVVHCNAGVGRSGTFVAYDIAMHKRKSLGGSVDIVALVKDLRRYRTLMVQTAGQLEFLVDVIGK